ncbi:hypothetical protein RRG08_027861 [Elysia crispata]|uniref:Heme-binding protein 2 n=1 Tax=Elysia crispata TaxID=231223 RepID=A0AAE1D571_9GAST|nr:hypothetical protein RRG08_027861 [Elysia crispata]
MSSAGNRANGRATAAQAETPRQHLGSIMAGNILITLAVIAASLAAVQCMSKPNFCNSYDCPPFDSQRLNGFELRSYGETMWVGTSRVVSSTSSSSSTSSMFQKLYRYIGGANSAGKRIKMTVPVATKVQALGGGQFRYTMMFYVPGANPPTPNDSDVEIIAMPARDVYVSFQQSVRERGR